MRLHAHLPLQQPLQGELAARYALRLRAPRRRPGQMAQVGSVISHCEGSGAPQRAQHLQHAILQRAEKEASADLNIWMVPAVPSREPVRRACAGHRLRRRDRRRWDPICRRGHRHRTGCRPIDACSGRACFGHACFEKRSRRVENIPLQCSGGGGGDGWRVRWCWWVVASGQVGVGGGLGGWRQDAAWGLFILWGPLGSIYRGIFRKRGSIVESATPSVGASLLGNWKAVAPPPPRCRWKVLPLRLPLRPPLLTTHPPLLTKHPPPQTGT